MSAGTWNGRPLWERNDSTASRCGDIIERGMRRLGLDTRAPAGLNKFLITDTSRPARSERANHERGRGLPCSEVLMKKLVAEWDKLPPVQKDFVALGAKHNLAATTARKVLRMAGREVPSKKSLAALRAKLEAAASGGAEERRAERREKRRAVVAARREARKQAAVGAWEALPVGKRTAERVGKALRMCPDFVARAHREAGYVIRKGVPKGTVSVGLVAAVAAHKKRMAEATRAVLAAYDAATSPVARTTRAIAQKLKMRQPTVGRILRQAGRELRGPAKHRMRKKVVAA